MSKAVDKRDKSLSVGYLKKSWYSSRLKTFLSCHKFGTNMYKLVDDAGWLQIVPQYYFILKIYSRWNETWKDWYVTQTEIFLTIIVEQ